jgi:hypothetical protein
VYRRVEQEVDKRYGHIYRKDENIAEFFDEIDEMRSERKYDYMSAYMYIHVNFKLYAPHDECKVHVFTLCMHVVMIRKVQASVRGQKDNVLALMIHAHTLHSGKDSGENQEAYGKDPSDSEDDSDDEDGAMRRQSKSRNDASRTTERPGAKGKTGRIANYEDDGEDDVDDVDMDAYDDEEEDELGGQWSDQVGGDSDNKEARQSVRDELLDRKSSKAEKKKDKGRGGRNK